MKKLIKKLLRETFEPSQDLTEEQIATNQEYIETFNDVFDWSQETRNMVGSGDGGLISMGLTPKIMKSDADNLIIKYAVDENKKIVYMVGLMAKSGKFKREDLPDYRLWIDRLMDYLRDGYIMITTANKFSQKLIEKLKSMGVNSKHVMNFKTGDSDYENFAHLELSL
tara:strand:- start:2411 stop:2914 length:504 start_codon:yes stop_codon:yes gene_type:complete